MKMFFLCVMGLSLQACGDAFELQHRSLIEGQPYVVAVSPADGERVDGTAPIEVTLSHPIEPDSVGPESVAVIPADNGISSEDLLEKTPLDGTYKINETDDTISFLPDPPPGPGSYAIVVTSALTTSDHLPFNQAPGGDPTPFVSTFTVEVGQAAETADPITVAGDSPVTPAPIPATKLLFYEIYYDAPGSDADGGLFIKLQGDPGNSVTGYKIVMVNGEDGKIYDTSPISKEAVVGPDGFYTVTPMDPQNGPDCLQLLSPQGTLADVVGYGTPLVATAENGLDCYLGNPAPDVSAGQSLIRNPNTSSVGDNSVDWISNPVVNIP